MLKTLLILTIKLYQKLSFFKKPCCRFFPSCSNYCLDAINKYGAVKGTWLGVKRICKCNPWNPGGFDPVP